VFFFTRRVTVAISTAAVITTGCGGSGSGLPSAAVNPVNAGISSAPADSTSILKKLTKDVLIGSTIDPKNGDTGPRAISIARVNFGLKKGQVLVCNFADASGTPGKGTTIEVFNPTPSSSPKTYVTNAKIQGCDGDALTSGNQLYAAGYSSGVVAYFDEKAKYKKSIGPPLKQPLGEGDLYNTQQYSTEYMFVGDAQTGGVINFAVGGYGNPKPTQVISGFAVSGNGWGALGPSGLDYDLKKDKLYILDGVTNTIISVSHPGDLLIKNEIVVQPGGKTFKCAHPADTCAKLIYSGSPLNAPVALTLLPNGNLIVANTKGGNTLVEITPTGQVLATKVIDSSQTAGIFALAGVGSNDSNAALYYTDTNSNELHKLEQ